MCWKGIRCLPISPFGLPIRAFFIPGRFPERAPPRKPYSLTRRKKTGPEKQAGRVMKKQMAPARNHYSLARRKKRPAKNKPPLSPGPREPRAFNILCSGSPIPIPRQPPGCFFLGWVPSRAPARNHYSLTRRKKKQAQKNRPAE